MSTERYCIQFEGGVVDGFSPEQAKQNFQALFKLSADRTDRLFDGSVRTLKKDLSFDEANRYRDRLLKAGGDVRIAPIASEASKPLQAEPKPSVDPEVEPETADKPVQATATSLSELSMVPKDDDESSESGQDEAQKPEPAARDAQASQPASSRGRFEARPVGSTPIPQAVKKQADPDDFREAPVEFVGKGGEYFGIWIVNILLTIVTFGIYSAWATVRNHQYFYGNTRLDGASFQYLANPVTILKGRLIAFGVFILYALVSKLSVPVGIILGIAFLFAIPWIVIRSLRFKAINSAYRNVRFDFEASYAEALLAMVVWPFLNIFTILLLTPFSVLKTHKFIGNGLRYGTAPFRFESSNSEYYGFFGKGLLIGIGFGVAAAVVGGLIGPRVALLIVIVGYLAVFGYFTAGLTNIFMSNLILKGHSFHSVLEPKQMVWLYMSNSVLVVLTLGLFSPWAKVRMARYHAACTEMVIEGDLDGFVAAENRRTSAIGQELGDAFDVGVAAF